MTKHFIVFGPPGSGKGTQAKHLVKRFGFTYLGTGDLMRQELAKGSELGKQIKAILESGKLVDDETTNKIVDQALIDVSHDESIVFDGYPRTLEQAKHLEKFFKEHVSQIFVMNLEVDLQNLIDRTSTRRVCKNCKKIYQNPMQLGIKKCEECGGDLTTREDDKPEVVKSRLDVYNKLTKPLMYYYEEHHKIVPIDGNPPIDEVWDELEAKVEKILNQA